MRNKPLIMMMMIGIAVGCKSNPQSLNPLEEGAHVGLIDAQKAFSEGDLYIAKRQTEAYLKAHPQDAEAEILMAQILGEELANHKEAFQDSSLEELPESEKKLQIKTLLERSRSLADMGEFDEAAYTAEQVFLIDPQNEHASKLLDQIKKNAWQAGKKEIDDSQEIVRSEMGDRAHIYRKQAQQFLDAGQIGAAKLSIDKLMILYPEDEEGIKLQEQLQAKQKAAAQRSGA